MTAVPEKGTGNVNPKREVQMHPQLFHGDNHGYFNFDRLEGLARDEITRSSLITRCHAGDRDAVVALQLGFWPFTSAFELAIDRRIASLPRGPLYKKFGHPATRQHIARTLPATLDALAESEQRDVMETLPQEDGLREMQKDEWKHSMHWRKDSMCIGITEAQLDSAPTLPGVQRLIDGASHADIVVCFAASYAATEFIAEALAWKLAHNPPSDRLFSRTKWIWMMVHATPHDEGPSHEEIVMDFARAFDDSGSPEKIESLVAEGIRAFGVAAAEVEEYYSPPRRMAAE
ncbi:MAG: hypothetical protein RIQ56_600 [Candidatus Parcubacteria bacterium]